MCKHAVASISNGQLFLLPFHLFKVVIGQVGGDEKKFRNQEVQGRCQRGLITFFLFHVLTALFFFKYLQHSQKFVTFFYYLMQWFYRKCPLHHESFW